MNRVLKSILVTIVVTRLMAFEVATATESTTRTITSQSQNLLTNNSNCAGNGGAICQGSAQSGGITLNINGGSLNFNLCNQGITQDANDLPCRVTPLIPPGADTQVGTGLNPISVNDNGTVVTFGGPTNDPVPFGRNLSDPGASNVVIPGFLVHGPLGERTLQCLSESTCGVGTTQNIITHFQSFRSVPTGVAATPSGAPCIGGSRCNHIEFSIDQQMLGDGAANSPFKIEYTIDSKTDLMGKMISATGSWAQTCSTGGCTSGGGTFTVTEPTGGFSPSSTGFVTINSSTTACPAGTLVDPFHQNGVSCR